jgi:hypothetical protein
MNDILAKTIPESLRDTVRDALSSAFGSRPINTGESILVGASGALTYCIGVDERPYLLRLETRRSPLRNPHQYTCMRIAFLDRMLGYLRRVFAAGLLDPHTEVFERIRQAYLGTSRLTSPVTTIRTPTTSCSTGNVCGYYAGILLASSISPSTQVTDLSAPTPEEFRALVAGG